jgi:hypothetical protein
MFKNVVFPAPFGPMIPTASLAFISKSTLFTAVKLPKFLVTPLVIKISELSILRPSDSDPGQRSSKSNGQPGPAVFLRLILD